MGRKLPPARTWTETTSRRKRKGPSLPPLSAYKRRWRTPEAVNGWASLPTDIVHLVTGRLLAGDVVDYIVFHVVCFGWRACTPSPRDPTLRKPDLLSRGWVALCDGDGVRPDDAYETTMFHTCTARRLRVRLPELRQHRIIGFTHGLVILVNKRTIVVQVLHPFTRVVVDLPSLVPVFHDAVKNRNSVLDMHAAVCNASATSIVVVVWFPWTEVVLGAEAGRPTWEVLHRGLFLRSILPFQGRLYATMAGEREIMQLYPRSPCPVLAHVPDDFGDLRLCRYFLVESGGQVLLVIHHLTAQPCDNDQLQRNAYKLFSLDIDRGELIPVSGLGGHALFLNGDRSLSLSVLARDLPSVSSDSIYFSLRGHPVMVHSMSTCFSEQLAVSCQIHEAKDRIRPSVRPFTIVDHLLTYCRPHQWTKGLMFHEYHSIPESFEELAKYTKAKESELRIPRVAVRNSWGRNHVATLSIS